jgi:PAS domain S-box-containing protein
MTNELAATILTIDDEASVRLSIMEYLEDYGFKAIGAENGRIGLEVFRREKPDLVLVDLRMPEVDGLEVLAAVIRKSPETPIIIVSGTGAIADVIEALRLGAWDYVLKPMQDMSILLHSVQKSLERARLMRENRRNREHLEEEISRRTKELKEANEELIRAILVRNETEKELAKSKRRLDSIVRSVPDIIYRLDPQGRISFVSEAVKNYGYTAEELLGRNILEIVHPEDREIARFRVNERRTGDRRTRNLEIRLLSKNQVYVPFEVYSKGVSPNPVFLIEAEGFYDSERPEKETFLGTQGVARDITLRKQTEAELQLLATAVEQVAESIIVVDPKGNIQYVNPAFEQTTGYTREEIIGQSSAILESSGHDNKFSRQIWNTLRCGESWAGRFTNRKKDGTLYQTEATISPILDTSGTIISLVSVQRDISEEIKLETQLRQAQKMEAIGTLAGGIAHDFNNILTAIIGNAQLLQLGIDAKNLARKKLDNILKASHRAKDLVMQILAFSRQTEKERQPVQIHLVVKETLKLLKASLPSTIEIRQNITSVSSANVVMADSTQIQQVLMNLCTNAHHAMRKKGGVLEIALSSLDLDIDGATAYRGLTPGPWIKLSVCDTGHGMDPATLKRIFDPYFTTKKKGVGTGLGLAVVHGIVKSHGGMISVSSKPGRGSTFHVFLPRIDSDLKSETETESLEPLPEGNNELILLVDDEEMVIDMVRHMIERLGYQVVTTTRPDEALKVFGTQPDAFDLVITDMTMPRMTGDVLARELMRIRPNIPVILCTGYSEMMTEEEASATGIRAFFLKPFTLADLSETIRKVLGKAD